MKPLPDIVIPPPLAEALRRAAHSALPLFAEPYTDVDGADGWLPRPDAPELIVVLLRTGELHFLPLEALAQAQGVVLPPVIYAHIGREMSARWERGSDPLIYWLFDKDHELFRDIDQWLRKDKYAQQIVARLQQDAEAEQVVSERVLVIDDCSHEGGTSTMARLLIRHAYELVDEPDFYYLYCGSMYDIVTATFQHEPFPDPYLCYEYLDELMRGYIETGTSCERITWNAHLQSLSDDIMEPRIAYSQRQPRAPKPIAPYPLLKAWYGDEALLLFREAVVAALVEVVLNE